MDTAGSHTWDDVLAGVQTLAELIQTCQDAFGEDEAAPKVFIALLWGCMQFCRSGQRSSISRHMSAVCRYLSPPRSALQSGPCRGCTGALSLYRYVGHQALLTR